MAAKVFIVIDVLFCEVHLVTFKSHYVFLWIKMDHTISIIQITDCSLEEINLPTHFQ